MKNLNLKTLTLSVALVGLLGVSQASANDMINNKASGFVGGDVHQSMGEYARGDVLVGAITANHASNNKASGRVQGDVYQRVDKYMQGKIEVGSIDAYSAHDNKASGYVGGDIHQHIVKDSSATLMVGAQAANGYGYIYGLDQPMASADAAMIYPYPFGGGTLKGNTTSGRVEGDIVQKLSKGSQANLLVGSIKNK